MRCSLPEADLLAFSFQKLNNEKCSIEAENWLIFITNQFKKCGNAEVLGSALNTRPFLVKLLFVSLKSTTSP